MAQHTAQHLLSGALLDRTQSETVSSRLGESALTIDLSRDRIPEAELAAAEALANDLIDDDLPVRAWFPEPGELASLALRRAPKVTENIRVVAIGDFDVSPCGGTHCLRTSQLGAVRITGVERYKGMTRVTFTAARRGREELFARDHALRGLAAELSCAPSEVPAAVERLRRDIEAGAHELGQVRAQLAKAIIDQFSGEGPVIAELAGDVELLRSIAAKLTAAGRDAILCTPLESGSAVVLMRAPSSTLDCAQLWKGLAAAYGGRGGGKPEHAEGKLASAVPDWPSAVASTLG
jgi:alanyl-tRNA synthetase